MINTNFVSREDYEEALLGLCRPLKKYYTKGNTGIYIGYTSAHYGDKIIGLEAYSRILWGIVPYMVLGKTTPLDEEILRGLRNGINPENEEYWGTYEDGSQAFVEMAVLGFALLMVPERFWEPLSGEERRMFSDWLNQINEHEISDNNWLFFRILVNCGLRKNGGCWSEERLSADLARIEDFYLGDGWYSDGKTAQRDYYISFAMHFYSLIYAGVMKKRIRNARRFTYKEGKCSLRILCGGLHGREKRFPTAGRSHTVLPRQPFGQRLLFPVRRLCRGEYSGA